MGNYAGFQKVKLTSPQKSTFDLGHHKRSTTRMGRLTPCLVAECVPSDTFRGSTEILLRLAPLLAPIYDQINLFVHFFFVPNRLLWNEWEEFITGGRLGVGVDPVTAPIPPFVDIGTILAAEASLFAPSSLADYLGCPIFQSIAPSAGDWNNLEMDIMPFAAYYLIYMEYYVDRNFTTDDGALPLASGELNAGSFSIIAALRTRSYLHDYFTASLPFTQRGEEVLMPLAGTGSVTYLDTARVFTNEAGGPSAPTVGGTPELIPAGGAGGFLRTAGAVDPNDGGYSIRNIDEVTLDASSVSINDFRTAYALQVWLERNAIGGSRYTESIQAHFDVKNPDSRLQRPEYIGGGKINVQISEIVAPNWSNDGVADVPSGNMAGHGVTYGNTNQFKYFCTEHGFIMGIVSIMNPPSYQQGLPRMFKRRTFLDYPWPTFAKLGEQPVYDFELYTNPASLVPDSDGEFPLFGYQSRYADWKYICNTNHGDFKDSLLFWTLTRTFSSPPVLSAAFNEFDSTTQDRIFAVNGTGDNFWMYINNKLEVKRPLPYFGTPNTLGFA